MSRILPVCLAVVCACAVAGAQPLICTDDVQCPQKHYCDTDSHFCRECLNCQDLKRHPPAAVAPTCIKSVGECGACYHGLVPDRRRGDVNAECVPLDAATTDDITSYLWLFIVVSLLFFGLVVGIIIYVVRNPEIFKTLAPSQSNITTRIMASAPEAPPPPYSSVPSKDERPDSPPYSYTGSQNMEYGENSHFMVHPPAPPPRGGREPAASQTARVYNKPAYLHEPRSPSPDVPDEPDEDTDFTIHDEETTMSMWTPNENIADDDVNANAAAITDAVVLVPAGGPLEPTPPKKRCVRQDSNNNRNRESSDDSEASPRPPSPGQSAPPFSFTTQIFNVVQINTNK